MTNKFIIVEIERTDTGSILSAAYGPYSTRDEAKNNAARDYHDPNTDIVWSDDYVGVCGNVTFYVTEFYDVI